jgi:hypothetical protein
LKRHMNVLEEYCACYKVECPHIVSL